VTAAITIRSATPADAAALLAIYRPFVESTAVSFETEVPSEEEFRGRIAKAVAGWAWLVAEHRGGCAGYAYASALREREAYRWSAETSAYVHPECYRQGVGRRLYFALFEALIARGFCSAFACVALPNDASEEFHRSMGFERAGVFKAVGRKFDAWHDVSWWQRRLRDRPPAE
jgi:L-amino acid N-acyltransferase YncA